MADPKKPGAAVVPLFPLTPKVNVAEEIKVGRPLTQRQAAAPSSEGVALDLTGQPKVVLAIGAGNTGKTSLLRWTVERAITDKRQVYIAAIDPENRELGSYFSGVHEPPHFEPNAVLSWLEQFLAFAMENKATAVIDLGGGDTTLGRLVASAPDIVQVTEDAGVSIVALYLLSPRLSDLSALASLEEAGFKPKATALVLNEGRADPTKDRDEEFARTMEHSAYKAAIARGSQQVWMPRLIPAKEIEDRRITYIQARDAVTPPGRNVTPLGIFDRSRVSNWLGRMDAEFAGIASWLP